MKKEEEKGWKRMIKGQKEGKNGVRIKRKRKKV